MLLDTRSATLARGWQRDRHRTATLPRGQGCTHKLNILVWRDYRLGVSDRRLKASDQQARATTAILVGQVLTVVLSGVIAFATARVVG